MNIRTLFALAGGAAFFVAGCATIVSGRTQVIYVDTPEVEGAVCELVDSKNGRWYLPHTPDSVMVRKGDGPMTVTCRKEGYETKIAYVEETISGAVFGNILIGGVVGIVIDSATGSAQKYPDRLVVWMQPGKFASKEAEKAWRQRRDGFEAMFEEPLTTESEAAEAPPIDPARQARIEEYIATNEKQFVAAIAAFSWRTDTRGHLPRVLSHEVVEANDRRTVVKLTLQSPMARDARPVTRLYLVRWVGNDLEVVAQKNAARKESSFSVESPSMVTREKVAAYLENSKRQFDSDLEYYLKDNVWVPPFQHSGAKVYSYEILHASTKRVILRLDYTYYWYGQRTGRQIFTLDWRHEKLVFVSHHEV